ncbi:hypothetical protein [Chryseobacterium carnipullorum]|uniref:Uncharacterized protein n=1 Tax=Chryseobacterium carnipullorum TaxID=1124835 RepID=A0A376DTG9_CHRCU|nr:hypothetical protein [Chryseobacterium carnipullorum]STC95289.1 Uncharacterised protein [Chryseobacterium carnipullorum]
MNFEHKITTTTTNNNNNNNDDCIKKKSNPINQSFKNFKLCGGTLICVIPIADKLVVVSDKRSINKSTGEIISDDIEKIIQINSNSVISITNVIYMDYGPKAPFPPYDVIAKNKRNITKKVK